MERRSIGISRTRARHTSPGCILGGDHHRHIRPSSSTRLHRSQSDAYTGTVPIGIRPLPSNTRPEAYTCTVHIGISPSDSINRCAAQPFHCGSTYEVPDAYIIRRIRCISAPVIRDTAVRVRESGTYGLIIKQRISGLWSRTRVRCICGNHYQRHMRAGRSRVLICPVR
jgi:hypothetical protein